MLIVLMHEHLAKSLAHSASSKDADIISSVSFDMLYMPSERDSETVYEIYSDLLESIRSNTTQDMLKYLRMFCDVLKKENVTKFSSLFDFAFYDVLLPLCDFSSPPVFVQHVFCFMYRLLCNNLNVFTDFVDERLYERAISLIQMSYIKEYFFVYLYVGRLCIESPKHAKQTQKLVPIKNLCEKIETETPGKSLYEAVAYLTIFYSKCNLNQEEIYYFMKILLVILEKENGIYGVRHCMVSLKNLVSTKILSPLDIIEFGLFSSIQETITYGFAEDKKATLQLLDMMITSGWDGTEIEIQVILQICDDHPETTTCVSALALTRRLLQTSSKQAIIDSIVEGGWFRTISKLVFNASFSVFQAASRLMFELFDNATEDQILHMCEQPIYQAVIKQLEMEETDIVRDSLHLLKSIFAACKGRSVFIDVFEAFTGLGLHEILLNLQMLDDLNIQSELNDVIDLINVE